MNRAHLAPIAAVILGELCFALMGGIIKHLATDLPNEVILFFRNSLAFVIIVPLLFQKMGVSGFKTTEFRFHAIRGGVGVAAMSCFFYILGNMNFTEAILLKLTTPFFIPLVALLWLGERSSPLTLWAIAIGFVGVIFIVDPQNKGWTDVDLVLVGLLGAVLAAVAKVTIRRMRGSEPSLRIVFYFSVFATLFSAPFAAAAWKAPSATQMLWLFGLASIATIGQLLITSAYRRVSAGKIGQFTYTSLIFSSTMGWMIWDEALTISIILGMLCIVGAGLLNMKAKH